jgi:hypothetical protein
MRRWVLIILLTAFAFNVQASDREYWTDLAYRMSVPVLEPLSRGELRATWTVEYSPTWDGRSKDVAYLEAFGRLMAGIAPWLALPDDDTPEGRQRKQLREWALAGCRHAVDPESPDYMGWGVSHQALVDASYLALGFLRAPSLWHALDDQTQGRYVAEFEKLRKIATPYNNWLLFRAMTETLLLSVGEEHDAFAIDVAMRKMNEWYVGDGWYSDGPEFALDYYNAYAIHPYMVEIAGALGKRSPVSLDLAVRRMQRYDFQIERLISPEGTYPPIGRSATYRMAAFHTLALSAWKTGLHDKMTAGQVRSALTAVMKRLFSMPGVFDSEGYLRLGMTGHQPALADYYTNSGSLYITSVVFLPLGLPADAPFWTAPAEPWTQQKAWAGEPFNKDYHESVRK